MDSDPEFMKMQEMYTKLYKRYSQLKTTKFRLIDEANEGQELKFTDFVSGADKLIEHLKDEAKRLSHDLDELRIEVGALRTAKNQEYVDLQRLLAEEKEKNRKLSAENEKLRLFHQEEPNSSDRTGFQSNLNNTLQNMSESPSQQNESPRRVTRSSKKRGRPCTDTNSPLSGALVGHRELVNGNGSLSDQHTDICIACAQPECCRSSNDNEGPFKCLFQSLVEWLTGMKVSVAHQPEGRCIRAFHECSGYAFDLTWFNKASQGEVLFYQVSSLGTLSAVAPEWMKEDIIFSMTMCPVFFERVSHVIKGG